MRWCQKAGSLKRWLCTLLLLFFAPSLSAQEVIDLLLEELQTEEEANELGSWLTNKLNHPLNINTATEAELLEVPFFDAFFVRNLLLERSREGGKFRSLFDLKKVPGAPTRQLPLLAPFLTVAHQPHGTPILQQTLFAGLETQLPFRQDKHRGIGWGANYQGRYGNNQSWSLVAGHDRGEVKPLDYLSFSYQYQAKSWLLIAGDYRVSAGLGLHLGQSLSYFSKAELSGTAPSLLHKNIRPHPSFKEYGFLRGVAGEVTLGDLSLSLFAGAEAIDARTEEGAVVTLYPGGMHRTKQELAHRHTALRSNIGGVLTYQLEKFRVGSTLLHQRYFSPHLSPMSPPKRHLLPTQTSLFFQYAGRRWQVSGETLLAKKDHTSALVTLSYRTDLLGRLSLLGYYVGNRYFAPHGMSNRKGSRTIEAIWSGEVARWWSGNIYLQYSDRGWASTLRAHYRSQKQAAQMRIRLSKERISGRIAHQYQPSPDCLLRSSLNLSKTAWAVAVRGRYQLEKGLRVEAGIHYFNTKGGVIRADQPYMPYRYYAPMLRGEGIRATAQIRYNINAVQLNFRGNHTFYLQETRTPTPSLFEFSTLIRL